jgi:hypothetical protein
MMRVQTYGFISRNVSLNLYWVKYDIRCSRFIRILEVM